MKRILCCLLICVLLLGLAPTSLAADSQPQLLQAQINFGGILHSAAVLKQTDGTVYAPLEWLTFYGGMLCSEDQGISFYYSPSQEELRNFAKRVMVDTSTRKYTIGLYFDSKMFAHFVAGAKDISLMDSLHLLMDTGPGRDAILDQYFSQKNTQVSRVAGHYMPLFKGTFSKMEQRDGQLWVPLAELLPLLDVNCAVSSDNRYLCMEPAQSTFLDILYRHHDSVEDLLFDSADVVGNDIMAGGGWLTATCTGELYNLNINKGRRKDYEEIFTSYLLDNEAYLSTFNSQSNTTVTYFRDVSKTFKGVKTIFSVPAEGLKPIYEMMLKDATDPDFYKSYFKPVKTISAGLDVVASAMTYVNAYTNQIDDHRLMLDAVYQYDADVTWPSYQAAMQVARMYESNINAAVFGIQKVCWDLAVDKASEQVYKKAFGGWYYAIELTKVICADDYEYVVESGKINLVSNTAQYAYDIYQERLWDTQFLGKHANDIRLCLMMSLIASRHAYETYWKGSRKEDVAAIDKILSELYLSGQWQDLNTTTDYNKKLTNCKKQVPKLQLRANDPVVLAEQNMLLHSLPEDYWAQFAWSAYDTNNDMYDEVLMGMFLKHQGKVMGVSIDPYTKTVTSKYLANGEADLHTTPEVLLDSQLVFGDTQALLESLDSHFATRDGILATLPCDLNGDGAEDRVYALYGASRYWNRDGDPAVNIPDVSVSLIAAEATDDGILLRFYYDPNNALRQLDSSYPNCGPVDCSYEDGTLLLGGLGYAYNSEGVPFKAQGSLHLQSIASYLQGEAYMWQQSNADVSYPYDYDRNMMDIYMNGVKFFVWAEKKGSDISVRQITVSPEGTDIELINGVTTQSTVREIINALDMVSWDSQTPVSQSQKMSAVMGPYPVMGVAEEMYECSILWQLPDGQIYMIVMQLHEESLDTVPDNFGFHRN